MTDIKDKSALDFIEDAVELLRKSKVFFQIVIRGKKTNIIIDKPKEKEKKGNKNGI